jgi:hypothetical protein
MLAVAELLVVVFNVPPTEAFANELLPIAQPIT